MAYTLLELVKLANKPQKDIAKLAQVGYQTLNKIGLGQRPKPKRSLAEAVLKVLNGEIYPNNPEKWLQLGDVVEFQEQTEDDDPNAEPDETVEERRNRRKRERHEAARLAGKTRPPGRPNLRLDVLPSEPAEAVSAIWRLLYRYRPLLEVAARYQPPASRITFEDNPSQYPALSAPHSFELAIVDNSGSNSSGEEGDNNRLNPARIYNDSGLIHKLRVEFQRSGNTPHSSTTTLEVYPTPALTTFENQGDSPAPPKLDLRLNQIEYEQYVILQLEHLLQVHRAQRPRYNNRRKKTSAKPMKPTTST